jgi:hypothetical protein
MALEYRFTKVALEVLAKAANPELRVYGMGIEVLRSVAATPLATGSSTARMQIMS